MKLSKLVLTHLLCFTVLPAMANSLDGTNNSSNQNTADNTSQLVTYLKNLGSYLGYDLTIDPSTNNPKPEQTLLNEQEARSTGLSLIATFLGAIPTISSANGQFVFAPQTTLINGLANATFNLQNYATPLTQGGGSTVTVVQNIDQQTYQQDPVSQSILNILTTPDDSFCTPVAPAAQNNNYNNNTSTSCIPIGSTSSTPVASVNQVMSNILGPIPTTQQLPSYVFNQPLVSQLNSNTLLAPLMLGTDNQNTNNGSSGQQTVNKGLPVQSQAQQAANFIRYVSGAAAPLNLPKYSDYQTTYLNAFPAPGNKPDPTVQPQAQSTLNTYFTSLRIFAAQSSVGMSNLYYILSKRLPQNLKEGEPSTSQALTEFNMATWRLLKTTTDASGNTNSSPNKQWLAGINAASPTTVQKEIAVLLAEINYQMYLDRQIQERILLTNTVTLMQNTHAGQPIFSSQGGSTK